MKCLSVFAALLLFSNAALAAPADDAFATLADRYVRDLPEFSPVSATLIGDHSADHKLDHVDAAARARTLALYRYYREALAAIDRDELSRANQVDAALLQNKVESEIWSLETLQEWAWNPLEYVSLSGSSVYGLVARDFAPLEERLAAAASRLEQMPRFLEQARESIQPERVPKIHAETAVQQNPGLVSIIETMIVPEMEALTPETRDKLAAAIEIAKDAIEQGRIRRCRYS